MKIIFALCVPIEKKSVCTPPLRNIWTYRNTRMYQGYCDTIVDANVILTQIYGYVMLQVK